MEPRRRTSSKRNFILLIPPPPPQKRSQEGLSISIASDLFTSEVLPLNPKFPRYAVNMFGSSVTPVPFDFPELTAELINGRFFNVTNGTIDGIVTAGRSRPGPPLTC